MAKHAFRLAITSAIIATLSAAFTGCQAYEAHRANEEARRANEEARRANERAQRAQEAQIALQQRAEQDRIASEQRRMAELVFLDKSPSGITDSHPDAIWSVKNLNRLPVSGVWVRQLGSGKNTVWKIGDIGACEAKGLTHSHGYNPTYVYFMDSDGRRWRRLNWSWGTEGDSVHAPYRNNEKGPGADWPDSSTGSVRLEDCPSS